jgi:recombination protein RecT
MMGNEQLVKLTDMLKTVRPRLESALPKGITVERIFAVAALELSRMPDLQACQPASVIRGIVDASMLGLEFGPENLVHLVPFTERGKDGKDVKKATLIVGYRGLCELARRSEKVQHIEGRAVHEADSFTFEYGSHPKLTHKRDLESEPGPITASYALAWMAGRETPVFEVLSVRDIEKIRTSSKGAGSPYSPWKNWPEEMAAKSAVRRLCKWLPRSKDIALAEAAEDRAYRDDNDELSEILEPPPPPSGSKPVTAEAIVPLKKQSKEDEPQDTGDQTKDEIDALFGDGR